MAKKNGKGNGKGKGGKKPKPVKPVSSRRLLETKKKKEDAIRMLVPSETKLAHKAVHDKTWRDKLVKGFLTGLTFGLYRP
jgi:hypothetical protein